MQYINNKNPNHPIILYNLACLESLRNNTKNALFFLSKSIDSGYTNFEKIQADEDLANIRLTKDFEELLSSKMDSNSNTTVRISDKIKELNKLKTEGLITESEYEKKRQDIIDNF